MTIETARKILNEIVTNKINFLVIVADTQEASEEYLKLLIKESCGTLKTSLPDESSALLYSNNTNHYILVQASTASALNTGLFWERYSPTFAVITSEDEVDSLSLSEMAKRYKSQIDVIYDKSQKEKDEINHPSHYTVHPSGVECITITEHMNFNLGNAVKYIWRCGKKGNENENEIKDLLKAIFYLNREISRIESGTPK